MRNPYINMIIWMGISAAISFLLTKIFGLWIGLALTFGVFVLINIIMRRRMLSGGGLGPIGGGVKYRCIVCGHVFKGGECPRCGSKMRSAEF
ncbi:MAG: hypothetical protein QW416_07530 [Candidatus Nitrosocaldaceae archaeon]